MLEGTVMEDEYASLRAFLEEHWVAWEHHCDNRGEHAQGIYEAIGGEPE